MWMRDQMKTRPIVSKRNQFTPADELVAEHLPDLPDQFKHPNFRAWLLRYTETVIKSVASHFGIAAQRGIEQAADLLCDPEFYETRKRRKDKLRSELRRQEAEQKFERFQRIHCPTQEQIDDSIRWAQRQIEYHDAQSAEYTKQIMDLKAKHPSTITESKSVM
jgi:hypothetical protein